MDNASPESVHVSALPPPKTRRKFYDVLRAHVGKQVSGICLHQEIIPVMTHWHPNAGGKVRHLATGCPWCSFFEPRDVRWYAYMPAWSDVLGKVIALEITHQAALDCSKLNNKRVPLRGLEMKLFRYGGSDHQRAGVTVTDYSLKKPLPPAIDVLEFLDSIFEKCERVPACAGGRRWKEEVQP